MNFRKFILSFAFVTASINSASAVLVSDMLVDDSAAVIGGGFGQSPTSDYLGVVSSSSPLQINGSATIVSSGFSPDVGDVIGRDLSSTGSNFTGDSITWTVNIPAVPAEFVPGTFNVAATFSANLEFGGSSFGSTQPNALVFDLSFDSVSQLSDTAESGNHSMTELTVKGRPANNFSIFQKLLRWG